MKIERTWFEGADPNCKAIKIAEGPPHYDFIVADWHVEIFVPLNGGPDGHVITLTATEAEEFKRKLNGTP